MPWIKTVPYGDADGLLKQEYDAAIKRAGRIYNIVSLQSLRPRHARLHPPVLGADARPLRPQPRPARGDRRGRLQGSGLPLLN